MIKFRLMNAKTRSIMGTVEVHREQAPEPELAGDAGAVDVLRGVLRRVGGDLNALDGWTNGYVQLRKA